MTSHALSYHGYRFPPEIISHAVWLYHRFCLSFRDTEDLLAQRGITVTYETIRQWCQTFGLDYARRLRRGRGRLGDTWYLDEPFVTIQGRRQYLWRAVDQDGDVMARRQQDILMAAVHDLAQASRVREVIAVSNEVGSGIVPTTRVGRRFRDLQGWANQILAAEAASVILVVAGLPLALKGTTST